MIHSTNMYLIPISARVALSAKNKSKEGRC